MDSAEAVQFNELIKQHEFHLNLSDILKERETEASGSFLGKSSILIRGLLCVILSDIKSQLRCFKGYDAELKIAKGVIDLPQSIDDLQKLIQDGKESTIIYAKFEADRKYIYEVIQNTYLELKQYNSFWKLKETICQLIQLENNRYELPITKEKNKIIRKNLAKQVKLQRCHIKVELSDANYRIETLKKKIDDSQPMFEIKRRYSENWQGARMEQHSLSFTNKEYISRSNISSFNQKYEQEVKVHYEIIRLTRIQINETLSKIEAFMEKYDQDLNDMDVQLVISKNKYFDTRKKRKEMEQVLQERATVMNKWIKFKEEREEIRLYKEKMTNAANIIQAWWRGLLVRLELGPFAVKEKKKKKKI